MGWSKSEKVPKKAELRGIVEGLAVSARLLETVQAPVGPLVPEFGDGTWSFEQYLQLEREKARARELFLPLVLLIVAIMIRSKLQSFNHMNWFQKPTSRDLGAGKEEPSKRMLNLSKIFQLISVWCSASSVDT